MTTASKLIYEPRAFQFSNSYFMTVFKIPLNGKVKVNRNIEEKKGLH